MTDHPVQPDLRALAAEVRERHSPNTTGAGGYGDDTCADCADNWPCGPAMLADGVLATPPSATEPAGLRARIEALPVLRLTGEQIDPLPDATRKADFFVDWDEHAEFVDQDAVLALLASAEPVEGPHLCDALNAAGAYCNLIEGHRGTHSNRWQEWGGPSEHKPRSPEPVEGPLCNHDGIEDASDCPRANP